ncbi:MAG: BrnA antitoxin family protein [Burkholderiaceae bacterium]
MKTIKFAQGKLPPLTAAQKAELEALAKMSDASIDTSDIPPVPEEFWANAIRGRFYKPLKTPLTVRVDADVLAWLKSQGKGYQTNMNAILRDAMMRSLHKT